MLKKKTREVNLPKQWRHWCADSGLRLYCARRLNQASWYYLKGRGFVWRLNCHGQFELGSPIQDFDRWALCQIGRVPMPTTRDEFRRAVASLLAAAHEAAT